MDSLGPLCTRCGARPADTGQRRCSKCRDANKRQKASRRARLQAQFGKSRLDELAQQTEAVGGYEAERTHFEYDRTQNENSQPPVAQPRNSGDLDNSPDSANQQQQRVAERPISVHKQPTSPDGDSGLRLVVADLHAPNQDERAFKALLAMMAEHRFAELVLLGDACELASLAWFGGPTTLQSYKDDAKAARQVLNRLAAQHGGPITLIEGNHDRRGDQKVERSAPQLYGSIKDEVGWDELGVRIVPEAQQPLVRGRLRFIHGHQDCGRFPPLRYAFKLATLYGGPGDSIIFGHTHKDQCDCKPMHGGPVHAYGLGTLERRPEWLKGADSWTCSVAVADPESGCVQVLPIRDGVMFYGGRRYAG